MNHRRPWPPIGIHSHPDQREAVITLAGVRYHTITGTDPADLTRSAMDRARAITARYQRPLPLKATTPDGTWRMTIHPDGTVEEHHSRDEEDQDPA